MPRRGGGGDDEHDAHRALLAAAHQRAREEYPDCCDVIKEGSELADVTAEREAGPRVERDRARPVIREIRRFPEVIPRVVAAEVHLAVNDEVAVRLDPRPEHEYHDAEESGDVVPPFEEIERIVSTSAGGVALLAHYTIALAKRP